MNDIDEKNLKYQRNTVIITFCLLITGIFFSTLQLCQTKKKFKTQSIDESNRFTKQYNQNKNNFELQYNADSIRFSKQLSLAQDQFNASVKLAQQSLRVSQKAIIYQDSTKQYLCWRGHVVRTLNIAHTLASAVVRALIFLFFLRFVLGSSSLARTCCPCLTHCSHLVYL